MQKHDRIIGNRATTQVLPSKQAGIHAYGYADAGKAHLGKLAAAQATSKSSFMPLLIGAGVGAAGYLAYKSYVTYNFATSINIGMDKVKVLGINLMSGLHLGISLAVSNPTQTTANFLHPMVDFGIITQSTVKDSKTGAIKIVDSGFNRLVQSLPRTPKVPMTTNNEPYIIPPLGRVTTDYIEFIFPPMTMIQMLGNTDWMSLVGVLIGNKASVLEKATLLKKVLLHSKYGIRPYVYVNGVLLPAIVMKF